MNSVLYSFPLAKSRVSVGCAITVAATLLLAGCATTSEELSSESSTEPTIPVGYEWTEIPFTGPVIPGTDYEGFSAGGAFWLYDPSTPTTLYGTTDGMTWRTVDVTEQGVPSEAGRNALACDAVVVGNPGAATFPVFYHTSYPQGHPSSLLIHAWMAETGPTEVSVSDGATVGLEDLPDNEGGRAYRTECVLGMEDLDGERVMVGTGQWWRADATGEINLFVAFQESDGSWKVHASSTEPFFKEWLFPYEVTKVGDRVIVLTTNSGVESGFDAWSSRDGLAWDHSEFPGSSEDRMSGITRSVTSGADGIAMWTNTVLDERQGHVWLSRDGLTWKHAQPFDPDWELTSVRIDAKGFTAYAYRIDGDNLMSSVKHSEDGVAWIGVEDANPVPHRLAFAIAHNDGLVVILDDKLMVSGLRWGTP